VLAASFGDNGQPVEQLAKSYTINAKIDGYKELIERGFVYHFTFPVKKPGAYQFRIAIRDNQGGNIGSASQFIQVPNLKKNRLTLSSIVLESLTTDQWKQISSGNGTPSEGDPMNDTALRRVKTGSILRYGFEVYNAKTGPAGKPDVTTRVRVIRDGSLVLDGRPTPLETGGQKDLQRIQAAGAISFGRKMQPGEYFLQIIVTDNSAKEKQKLATQFVQFEVVE
jgi:hypothetical protein